MNRRSYRQLAEAPSWGIYRRGKILAAVRAEDLDGAKKIFTKHSYFGKIRRLN